MHEKNQEVHSRYTAYIAEILAASFAYFLLAKFGLSFQAMGKFASLIWPSAGFALAGLLLFGRKYWPAILLGEFVANVTSGAAPVVALAMGTGNALDVLICVTLLRMTDFNDKIVRVRDVLLFVVYGILLSAIISPTIGVTSLWLGGVVSDADYWTVWPVWYVGDLLAILALTPLILVWREPWLLVKAEMRHRLEFFAIVLFTLLMGFTVFLNIWQVPDDAVPMLLYPVFLPVFWATRRFGRHGATLSTAILAVFAVWGTFTGKAPFNIQSDGDLVSGVVQLALYFIAVGLTGLIVAAASYEQETAEMQSLHAMGRLNAANKAKDEFLAMLAHELRNPLAPLLSSIQILQQYAKNAGERRRSLDQVLHGSVETASRQINNMARLLDDLLDRSRIDRGNFNLRIETIDIRDVARSAVESVTPLLRERKYVFSAQIPETPMKLQGDPLRLEQAIVNLLNNAAKYTEPGGAIGLDLEKTGNAIRISVQDNGMGLAAEDQSRVFDPFWKVAVSDAHRQSGLGLGLKLVKSIVEMHGGSISVQSAGLGMGCLFQVELPGADHQDVIMHDSPNPVVSLPVQRKILVVDDNIDAADSLKRLLEQSGHAVKTAYDGASALLTALQFEPQVVFLDIGMPDMDGYETAKSLRRQGFVGSIVALTGYGQSDDRWRAKEAGFDYHLLKPAGLDALLQILASVKAN